MVELLRDEETQTFARTYEQLSIILVIVPNAWILATNHVAWSTPIKIHFPLDSLYKNLAVAFAFEEQAKPYKHAKSLCWLRHMRFV